MITFLLCLTALVAAYFLYGRFLERICDIDDTHPVPSQTRFDGVDYLPLPRWKVFLIQLLNIAGLGPIFGAVLGAAYGPVAFLWITLGGIFLGGMHDMVSGVIILKRGGVSLPEVVGDLLGTRVKNFMRLFSVVLMLLVGVVFLSQPTALIVHRIGASPLDGTAFGSYSWCYLLVMGAILVYYVLATMLPVDKIIGKLYPVFGAVLLVMAAGILGVLLFRSGRYAIPELTSLRNGIADPHAFPLLPMLFTTIACGAISGFHATQSPLMARCLERESQCRPVFYGSMITESIIALIWAAIAMAFWGGVGGLNEAIARYGGNASVLIDRIATDTLGGPVATLVIFGVIACAITSGDTAFRSARLIIADFTGLDQRHLRKRLCICLPLFAVALLTIFALPFQTLWSYFAWTNQTLAAIVLWMITVWLFRNRKPYGVALLPALFMTYVCTSYIFVSPLMCGMSNRPAAYLLGAAATTAIGLLILLEQRYHEKGIRP